jgi:hypothetical protein
LNSGVVQGSQPDIPRSANTIKEWIHKRYISAFHKKKEELVRVTSKVSYTTDIWTSPAKVAFMALTAHWIDNDWAIHCWLLNFFSFPGSHTGVRLAEKFESIIDEWGLKEKSLRIIVDMASNYNYFAHALNLACKEALNEIIDSLACLQEGVKAIRYSNLKMGRLEAKCKEKGVKFLKPILDVATCWNSSYDMLHRSLKLKIPLQELLNELWEEGRRSNIDEDKLPEVTEDDWKVLI